MNNLRAYNCGISKDDFIAEIKSHMQKDALIKGVYKENENMETFRGCAIGCSIQSIKNIIKDYSLENNNHYLYEKYLGIPLWLAKIEDKIFEGLPIDLSKKWPLRFSLSINIGSDLNTILPTVLIFIIKL